MTKQEAIEYLEKVMDNWTNWHTHHERLVAAIEILLEETKKESFCETCARYKSCSLKLNNPKCSFWEAAE